MSIQVAKPLQFDTLLAVSLPLGVNFRLPINTVYHRLQVDHYTKIRRWCFVSKIRRRSRAPLVPGSNRYNTDRLRVLESTSSWSVSIITTAYDRTDRSRALVSTGGFGWVTTTVYCECTTSSMTWYICWLWSTIMSHEKYVNWYCWALRVRANLRSAFMKPKCYRRRYTQHYSKYAHRKSSCDITTYSTTTTTKLYKP